MKNFTSRILLLIVICVLALPQAFGQRIVDVAPGIGTLNETIYGDTTESGARVDSSTIYRLQRGPEAYYLLSGSIENRFPLTIIAEDGDGARPFLQPNYDGGSSRAFRARADLSLKGIHVSNQDNQGGWPGRLIRASADDITICINDCWLEKDNQAAIRVDDPGMTIKIKNSIIGNIGQPDDPNNGRGIDDRGNDIDTVIIENTTFYNISSRIIRDGGGDITYARFTNNTVVNIAQHGITFGPVETLICQNNLFHNAGFFPQDTEEPNYIIGVDSMEEATQSITITNNSFYVDTLKLEDYITDTTAIIEMFSPDAVAFINEANTMETNIHAMVTFDDAPAYPDSVLIYNYNPDFDIADAPFWVEPDIPSANEGGNGVYHADFPYDFSYTCLVAVTAGTDETPLGDTNWEARRFPTSVDQPVYQKNSMSVYPNPLSSRCQINFNLNGDSRVIVSIINITGVEVMKIMDDYRTAGNHSVAFDNQLKSGIYIVKLQTGKTITTQKVLVQQ